MKKLGRDAVKLETINLFSLLQDDEGSALYNPQNRQSFLTQVDSGFGKALTSESTLHGIRAQTMFEGMVANLGSAKLIKQEDAGECYYDSDDISLPDFRVVTSSNEAILIETKSHFHRDPFKHYRTLKNGVVERLRVKDPASLAPVIPLKFEKKSLPLWRFVLQPNADE